MASQVAPVAKNLPANSRDVRDSGRLRPWEEKISRRRALQHTPVLLPGESHGQRSLQATVHRVAKSWTRPKKYKMCQIKKKKKKIRNQKTYTPSLALKPF